MKKQKSLIRCTGVKRLAPHQFQTTIELLSPLPSIFISKTAYDRMCYIVSESAEEVSWLGTVERNGMDFLISEVFLFDQEVHATQTRLDEEAVGAFFADLASQPDGIEKVERIRFWGHSHVHMGVTPSGCYGPADYGDLGQMHSFGESCDYMIMGIANKNGMLRFEIFLYDLNLRIQDVEWGLYELEQINLREQIATELKTKVRYVPPLPVTPYGSLAGSWEQDYQSPASAVLPGGIYNVRYNGK